MRGRRCRFGPAGGNFPGRRKAKLLNREMEHVDQELLVVGSRPRWHRGFPPSYLPRADHQVTEAELRCSAGERVGERLL